MLQKTVCVGTMPEERFLRVHAACLRCECLLHCTQLDYCVKIQVHGYELWGVLHVPK